MSVHLPQFVVSPQAGKRPAVSDASIQTEPSFVQISFGFKHENVFAGKGTPKKLYISIITILSKFYIDSILPSEHI